MSNPSQQSQLEATFLHRLEPKAIPAAAPPEYGELAGRRRDTSLFALALHRIRPDEDQVRQFNKNADDSSIQELAESIRSVGVLQPIDVRYLRDRDYYEIIAGERRYTAAKLAGLQEVPVKLIGASDAEVCRLQILENIHREALSPLELGTALLQLTDAGATPDDLCRLLCKDKSFVTKALSVARNLSVDAKSTIQNKPERFQSMAHLYEVSLLPPERQRSILERISDEELTRDQLQVITGDIKQPNERTRIGRPRRAPSTTRTIALANATVTIRLPKIAATNQELVTVLQQAIDTLR